MSNKDVETQISTQKRVTAEVHATAGGGASTRGKDGIKKQKKRKKERRDAVMTECLGG